MKTYTKQERALNILSKAVALGFEIDLTESVEEQTNLAEQFLIDTAMADKVEFSTSEDYCPVKNHGRSQHASYNDRMGYVWECDGEICTEYNAYNAPNHRYYHSIIVNSVGDVVRLYDVQGENEFNTANNS